MYPLLRLILYYDKKDADWLTTSKHAAPTLGHLASTPQRRALRNLSLSLPSSTAARFLHLPLPRPYNLGDNSVTSYPCSLIVKSLAFMLSYLPVALRLALSREGHPKFLLDVTLLAVASSKPPGRLGPTAAPHRCKPSRGRGRPRLRREHQ